MWKTRKTVPVWQRFIDSLLTFIHLNCFMSQKSLFVNKVDISFLAINISFSYVGLFLTLKGVTDCCCCCYYYYYVITIISPDFNIFISYLCNVPVPVAARSKA